MSSVKTRARRPSAHQQRVYDFQEAAYQALRSYQKGELASASGVAAGQLDVALTNVLDTVTGAAVRIFTKPKS